MSVFTNIPESAWVASNDLAFAVRDRYPVTEGHTLVITRRVVPTWFEATREEREAVMDLVDVVKRQLDDELQPAGYNVGFNAGAAAGQTIDHLHVHVIPRYPGDMNDPRGGVRHVIPSRGNYALDRGRFPDGPFAKLTLGGREGPFIGPLRHLLRRADEIAIVSAFVQDSGLEILEPLVHSAVARGVRIRLLTSDYLNITQAEALERIADWWRAWQPDGDDDAEGAVSGRFEARVIEVARLPKDGQAFHPKSWRFEGPGLAVLFVGSSNISRSALQSGVEWNLAIDRDQDPAAYARAVEAFGAYWTQARELDADWIAEYAARARRAELPPPIGETEAEASPLPPEPHEAQRTALDRLREARIAGRSRGLVVFATGLGKTWLAAFDAAQMVDELGRPPRVLFIAHRREILRQAARTFRIIGHLRWPESRVNFFVGSGGSLEGEIVFASVQKLARPANLAKLSPDAFDYVVVDEVHHAAAPSYRRVLDHLEPRFVLGLTATPDRADEADLLGLFDDHVVHRAGLEVGIRLGRLVPFAYFGIKDDVDYSAIPWRNRRFDPHELAKAVQTQQRMEKLWAAWQEQPRQRTLVFCASIEHARFVRDWLKERGVDLRLIHSGEGADDRDEALEALSAGTVHAVCSVDVLNEGVDVPAVDRVVMLRPTESPVVFLQQLGRGLRCADGHDKASLTVIDFVGNHRTFLSRIRQLASFGGAGQGEVDRFLGADERLELPTGCSVDVELEAKDMLQKLVPSGRSEVERVYRELRDARGERPTIGELYRLGYLPSTLRQSGGHASWFDFVEAEGDLDAAQAGTLSTLGPFLRDLESTAMTRCFKMALLLALLESDALPSGLPLDALCRRSHRVLRRSPELWADVADRDQFDALGDDNFAAWRAYWRKNPVAAWLGESGKSSRGWFRLDGDRFVPTFPVAGEQAETAASMVRELVDYRLAQYRTRRPSTAEGPAFDCKVTWNKRDPILKLPNRKEVSVPDGETDVRLPDGSAWTFRFMKEFCNVARPVGARQNQLPDLMRSWFGPNAGRPGTDFRVRFAPSPDGWWLERLGEVIALSSRRSVRSYPDLRAAAGAATDSAELFEGDEVLLPAREQGEDVFAVRAAGRSMDGGPSPIRDGDWLVMRFVRGQPLSAVEGRVALLQLSDEASGFRFQVKRVVQEGASWKLVSSNPEFEDFEASAQTVVVARLGEVIRPEALAPTAGTRLRDDQLSEAFGLEAEAVERALASLEPAQPALRMGGHLFVAIQEPGTLVAPDRMRVDVQRRPGETAFILARTTAGEPWRYCGVGRFLEDQDLWTVPSLDHATYKALGSGRSASRTLPPEALERARENVRSLLEQHPPGSWVEARGKRCRIVGMSPKGGLRIDGGDTGFAERTVSLVDLAWALLAQDDVAREGGILDEARVNRLRYLEGTPKAATRWIDTGWALVLIPGR